MIKFRLKFIHNFGFKKNWASKLVAMHIAPRESLVQASYLTNQREKNIGLCMHLICEHLDCNIL